MDDDDIDRITVVSAAEYERLSRDDGDDSPGLRALVERRRVYMSAEEMFDDIMPGL